MQLLQAYVPPPRNSIKIAKMHTPGSRSIMLTATNKQKSWQQNRPGELQPLIQVPAM